MDTLKNNTVKIIELLGTDNKLLTFNQPKISRERLYIPNPDTINEIFGISDRNTYTLINLSRIYNHGRLGGTGYLSVLPVDQGIEHTGGSSFAPSLIISTLKTSLN